MLLLISELGILLDCCCCCCLFSETICSASVLLSISSYSVDFRNVFDGLRGRSALLFEDDAEEEGEGEEAEFEHLYDTAEFRAEFWLFEADAEQEELTERIELISPFIGCNGGFSMCNIRISIHLKSRQHTATQTLSQLGVW